MKGYILRDKEAEEEAKKAIKAKNQGQWIRGAGNVRRMGDLSGSGQSLFQDQPLEASFLTPPYWDSGSCPPPPGCLSSLFVSRRNRQVCSRED